MLCTVSVSLIAGEYGGTAERLLRQNHERVQSVQTPVARSLGCIQTAAVGPLRQSADATDQSRSNSLMLVLARVRSSTRLTITAQAVAGPGWPFFKGFGGSVPGTTTEYSGTSPT
jgi:hypothetical protein